jgi:predicted XRE-type DNA-binding protein
VRFQELMQDKRWLRRAAFPSVWDALEDNPAEATNMQLRSALMIVIRQVLVDDRGVTQAATVRRLDVAQPHAIGGYRTRAAR